MNKIVLMIICLFMLLSCNKDINKNTPTIKNGILDLRNWDLKKNGPVKLDGQWKFFWNEFVPLEKMNNIKDYSLINVPANWAGQIVKNKKLPNFGYATYYIKILHSSNEPIQALKIKRINTAYECYVNKKKVSHVGKIGKTHHSMSAKIHPKISVFYNMQNETELIIYVSNFHYRWGGLSDSIFIGKPADINLLTQKSQKEEFFIFGILIIMFLYHLGLYILRTKDNLPLIFGIFCLSISGRVLIRGEISFLDFFPSMNLEWLLTIEYLSVYYITLLFTYFIQESFQDEFNKKILWATSFIALFYTLFTLFTPAKVFTFYLKYFQIVILVLFIYFIAVLIKALYRKREGALALFLGIMACIIVTINDILLSNSIINSRHIFYYGVIVLVFCQAYMISSRFSKVFYSVENLSNKLEQKNIELHDLNKNLEHKVEERTEELQVANDNLIMTRDALWGEMHVAKKIQTVLLPEKPKINGYDIIAYMNPADDVGGDYYDVININDMDWILIGDVSGHGLPAGLIMMMTQTAVHSILQEQRNMEPSTLLRRLNAVINENIHRLDDNKYITITAMKCFQDGKFKFAGLHQDILIYRKSLSQIEVIQTNGMWIGLTSLIKGSFKDNELKLESGDTMLLFTDGLTEAWRKGTVRNSRDIKNDIYGIKQLIGLFHEHGNHELQSIKNKILDSLENYDCDDDVSFVVIRKN